MTQELVTELMRQADTLTPDEQLRLAAYLEQMAHQADPYAIIHRRRTVIDDRKPEILALAAKYGAENVRVFSLSVEDGGISDTEVNFLVNLEPGRSLLDQGGLLMDLRELLGFELYVFTEGGLKDRYQDLILEKAVAL